jgi:radical SAM superfamily enzyme YgiQ (UPF0313 family)
MKVVLVNPPMESDLKSKLGLLGPPLGLAYLSSLLERDGHDVRILDCPALGLGKEGIQKELERLDPELVGVTSTTASIYGAFEIIKIVKKLNPECWTVLGGPHATFTAKQTLKECPQLDFVVRSEGELTFRELVNNLPNVSGVRGLSYRQGERLIENEDRYSVDELDELPFPAYHLLPMEKYIFGGKRFATIITSRGCPFRCIFCSSSRLYGKRWRARSPENVVEEIRELVNGYGVNEIEFLDDTFTLSQKRVMKICDLVIEEGLDISWSCSSRVDTFSRELAKKLKKAGCHSVYFGVESASENTLRYLKKGITPQQAKNALEKAKEADLNTIGSFILGIPGETENDMMDTIKFAIKLDPTLAQFTVFTPFPGTEAYEMAKRENLLLTRDWSKFTTLEPVLKLPKVTIETVKKLIKKAYLSFYLRPSFIWSALKQRFFFKVFGQLMRR